MPRTDISAEGRTNEFEKFPTLTMTVDGERARIWCPERNPQTGNIRPWAEWVHVLRAPVIVNGEVVMEETESRDGSKTERQKLDFIGQPICLGLDDIIRKDHVDPEHCPACESAERGYASPPEIKYSTNVIKYAIKPGGFTLAEPFAAQVLMWRFPANRYSALVDIQADAGPLIQYDLLLGPTEKPAKWQKYKIAPSHQGVAWQGLKDARVSEYIKALWNTEGNRATDAQLEQGCGRRVVNRNFLLADLRDLERRMDQANGTTGAIAPPAAEPRPASVSAGLDNLLDEVSTSAAEAEPTAATADWLGGIESPSVPNGAEPVADEAEAAQGGPVEDTAAPDSTPAPGDAKSWDDMLNELK